MTAESLGKTVRRLRVGAGLTQVQLADRASVTRSWLGTIEQGKRPRPDPDMLRRVARALGIHPNALLVLAGYDVAPHTPAQTDLEISDPELALMLQWVQQLEPDERDSIKEYIRFVKSRAKGA